MRAAWALAPAALLVLAAGGVDAAIGWSSQGTLQVGVAPPTLKFQPGAGATKSRFVTDVKVSTNQTWFTANLAGRSGADARAVDLVRLTNVGTTPQNVTIIGATLDDPRVIAFSWTLRVDGATVGTLDHKAASPRASFTLAPGATATFDMRLVMGSGTQGATAMPFWLQAGVAA